LARDDGTYDLIPWTTSAACPNERLVGFDADAVPPSPIKLEDVRKKLRMVGTDFNIESRLSPKQVL
jgi:hypothetical protein